MLMSSTRSLLRLIARDASGPSEVLTRLNRVLLDDFPAGRFVTMVYAVLDAVSRSVVFASAGHLPPLLVDATGGVSLETQAGLPLGTRKCDFSERTVPVSNETRLVFYSDGITEASNSSGEEYGIARVQDHLRQSATSVHTLLEDVRGFSSGAPAADDATVVMIEASRDATAG